MSRLPTVTPQKVLAALKRAGFREESQHGSHLYLYHPITERWTTVPMHNKDLDRGLLRQILRQTEISVEEFRKLL